MAKFTKRHVLATLRDQAMVSLFYHPDLELGKEVMQAVYEGGGRIVEFTSRGDYAHEVFHALAKYCLSELPEMILGVGSVTDAGTTSMYMQSGASFIVTPNFKDDIARVCNRRKVPYMPGCASLTEMSTAEEAGCDIVKLFPGSVYGPGFVKAVLGPQPWTEIMPTGGVSPTEENLKGWFDAGVTCVGMGSQLISREVLATKDWRGLTKKTKDTLALIQTLKKY